MPIRCVRELEDDFEMFPLEHAIRDLDRVIGDHDRELSGMDIPPPKYRPVPLEMQLEACSILAGAAFVMGQAMINKTLNALERARDDHGAAMLPGKKHGLLAFESDVHEGAAVIPGINALANYFKHNDEWARDWSGPGNAQHTIAAVRALGLTPRHPDNMRIGSRAIGICGENGYVTICEQVGSWRRRLAARLRNDLGLGLEFSEIEDDLRDKDPEATVGRGARGHSPVAADDADR